jgi:DegV family protein with EDD domain
MTKYIIVAESGADIPPELAERHHIFIAPMHLLLGKTMIDDGAMPVHEVFSHFERTRELPKTSGSTPSDFEKVFDEIHGQNPEATIIHLAYSAVTTCSYESAVAAAKGRDYVRHYNTENVSIGQGMVVLSVAEFIEQNPQVGLEQLDDFIKDRISRARLAFLPSILTYLHAGGRLSNLAFMGAQILKIRPLIEIVEGKLVATKKYRGSMISMARKMIEDYLGSTSLEKKRLILAYSSGLGPDTRTMAEEMVGRLGFENVSWMQTGCVVSSHAGPGAFGIAGFATN